MDARKQAINSKARVLLIQGKPGVGKTFFGCQFADHALNTAIIQPKGKILILTFARNAVARIRQVFLQQTTSSGGTEVDRLRRQKTFNDRVRMETFAGFFWWLISAYGRYEPGGSALRPWFIGKRRVGRECIPQGHKGYTFTEIEQTAAKLLSIPAIRKLISEIYPLVVIDEHQDVDESLHNIIALLAEGSRLVLLRGPGQCIYRGLRGSDPQLILNMTMEQLEPEVYDIEALGEGRQRCCTEIEALISQYNEGGKCVWDGDRTIRKLVQRNKNNSYLLDIEACRMVDTIRKTMRQANPEKKHSIAVMASTNQAVANIYDRLQKGSSSFRVPSIRASLHFDDGILLQYGRILLELLSDHWISFQKVPAKPENVAVALTVLTESASELQAWLPWTRIICKKMQSQHKPTDNKFMQRLQTNVDTINGCLRATAKSKPQGTPRSPFNANDTALLTMLRDEILRLLKPNLSKGGSVNIQEVKKSFERELQHRIVLEKLGIEHGVQVMTIHKAKGREFDGVVLVLEDNQTALWRTSSRTSDPEAVDLYRVGISRARDFLALVAYNDIHGDMKQVLKGLLI